MRPPQKPAPRATGNQRRTPPGTGAWLRQGVSLWFCQHFHIIRFVSKQLLNTNHHRCFVKVTAQRSKPQNGTSSHNCVPRVDSRVRVCSLQPRPASLHWQSSLGLQHRKLPIFDVTTTFAQFLEVPHPAGCHQRDCMQRRLTWARHHLQVPSADDSHQEIHASCCVSCADFCTNGTGTLGLLGFGVAACLEPCRMEGGVHRNLKHDDDGKCTAASSLFQTCSQFLNALQLQVDKQKSTDREMSTELLADRLVLRLLEILCPKGSAHECGAFDTLGKRRRPSTGDPNMTASCSSIQSRASASTSGRGVHLSSVACPAPPAAESQKYCEANEPNKARGARLIGTVRPNPETVLGQAEQPDPKSHRVTWRPPEIFWISCKVSSSSEPDGTERPFNSVRRAGRGGHRLRVFLAPR